MISLPLNHSPSYTASSLAQELDATIVIRVDDGRFDAYVHAGQIGTDFSIEMGKGYIVNLTTDKTFKVTGKPWADPAAPAASIPSEPWAFVVAGRIEGSVPAQGYLRITNRRTGENRVVQLTPSGEFTAAFVDINRRRVVEVGDEVLIELIGPGGVPLTAINRLRVEQSDFGRAYLLTRLNTAPQQTRLLQNYPNPFNPETWIPYTLAEASEVTIRIYDLHGREVRSFALGYQPAGWYHSRSKAVHWDGRNGVGERISSGVYWVGMEAGTSRSMRRLVVLK